MPTDDKDKPVINNPIRQSFNNYVSWLRQKGIAGSPELDKGGLGNALLDQYIRENPGTYLRPEHIKPIQEDFANYRNFAINQVKAGKAVFDKGVDESNFMTELSKLDNYGGSRTTAHVFPHDYMQFLDSQGKVEKTEDRGFATTQK